jgi:hypothetical protein
MSFEHENENASVNANTNANVNANANDKNQNKTPLNEDMNGDQAYGIVTTGVEPIEMTNTGSKIIGYVAANQRETVRLGTYVIIPYENKNENENLFGKVTKLQYRPEFSSDDATEIHTQRMLSKKGAKIDENDYKLLTSIEPICILYEKNQKSGLQRRMADRIPKPNTPILPVLDKEKVQVGLNIPKAGIFLGHLSVGGELIKTHQMPPTVAYYLRNDYSSGDPLIFRHIDRKSVV